VKKNFRTSLEGVLEKVRKGFGVVSEFGRGLSHIRVPTLITVGRYDYTPVKLVETVYNGIPNSKLVVFEDGGGVHFIEENQKFIVVNQKRINVPTHQPIRPL